MALPQPSFILYVPVFLDKRPFLYDQLFREEPQSSRTVPFPYGLRIHGNSMDAGKQSWPVNVEGEAITHQERVKDGRDKLIFLAMIFSTFLNIPGSS
jgi:hypothetical protein